MQTSIDQTHWYDRIWAAFIFFTRLPFWRLHQPPQASYKTVVEHWPLAGWLTGGVMAATLYVGSMYLPYIVAVLLAIIVRLLVTGALHEDGLADFLDGFGGGGHDRERILAIMKDSHIGTYGVLGLILYEVLLAACLFSLPPTLAALTILAADPYAKMVTAQLILMMPYARRGRGGKEQDRLSQDGLEGRHQSCHSGLVADGLVSVVHWSGMGAHYLPALPNDVLPLPAHLEPSAWLYGRLLWSRLSAR